MQKGAGMAVCANSNHKAPLRRARLTQFRFKSAPTKAGGLSVLGSAVRAWGGRPGLCAHERRWSTKLRTPSR